MAPIISQHQDGDEEYIPFPYSAPRGVQNMHGYPRWGYPTRPVYLYGDDATSAEKEDYLRGWVWDLLQCQLLFVRLLLQSFSFSPLSALPFASTKHT